MTLLPRDDNVQAVQTLRLGTAHQVAIGATSARNATAFTGRVIRLHADTDCFIRTGDATVVATASDHFLPAGETTILSIGAGRDQKDSHIAVIQKSAAGTLYVSELV